MVEAEGCEHRGVEIVGVDGPLDRQNAMLVGFPVDDSSPDSPAGHPGAEDEVVVLAAGVIGRLVERRPSELAGPDDERSLEHPPALQIGDQAGDRLVDRPGELLVIGHVAVRVPVVARADIDKLDESHAALGEPAGDEALPTEALRRAALEAVEAQGLVGLSREIKDLRRLPLHAEGGLERTQSRRERPVAVALVEVGGVDPGEEVELQPLDRRLGGE